MFTFHVDFQCYKNLLNSRNPGKLGAVRTRGPDGKIRTAGARGISQSGSRILDP